MASRVQAGSLTAACSRWELLGSPVLGQSQGRHGQPGTQALPGVRDRATRPANLFCWDAHEQNKVLQ